LASAARSPRPSSPRPAASGLHAAARWLSLPRTFTLAVLLAMLVLAIQPVTDPDFWWHLTTGNWILVNHAVPSHDLYTYTVSNHRWITHEWLSEVLLAVLFAMGRLPLVSLVLGLVTMAGFILVFLAIDRRVNFLIAGLSLALGVGLANPIWGPRIQMITFTLAALTLLWIKRFLEGRNRALYALPLVVLVWANLHAGFLIAWLFLGLAIAAELIKHLLRRADAAPVARLKAMALILLASVAVAVVNPNGWEIYKYALQTQGSAIQQKLIVEWFSPDFQRPEMYLFAASIFLLLGLLALARRIELRQFLFLLLGLGLALHSVRHLTFYMMVAVPAIADYGQQAWERLRPMRARARPLPVSGLTLAVNSLVVLGVALTMLVAIAPSLTQRVDGKLVRRDFPVAAADMLAAHPAPGRMLNVYGWGGYLIYRLHGVTPAQPVFIFGDAALTGDRVLQDYAHLQYLNPDQAQLLDRYQINWIIFHKDDAIVTELSQNPAWFRLGNFGDAAILMRNTPANHFYASTIR
jgi:hypothetical protein